MKIDYKLDNFDWKISISEKEKVKQKSESPKTSNKKEMVQRTDNKEEIAKSDEEYPLQLAPGNLHMLLGSSRNSRKIVTLNDLGNRSGKQYNQAGHNRKLSKEETCNQSDVDFTADSLSNIKEPRIKNFIEIKKNKN